MNPTVLDQIVRQQEEIESLREQLTHREAQIVMLREALEAASFVVDPYLYPKEENIIAYALAATDDLDGLILCERAPFCYLTQTSSERNPPHGWSVTFSSGEVPLYRATRRP